MKRGRRGKWSNQRYYDIMTTCCRGGEEILKYDRVLLNAGDGLNPDTGVFSCPAPGTYMFIIHIATHKDKVTSLLATVILS